MKNKIVRFTSASLVCIQVSLAHGMYKKTLDEINQDLMKACFYGSFADFQTALHQNADVNYLDPHLFSPVYALCSGLMTQQKRVAMLESLVQRGADVNNYYAKQNNTPLHRACTINRSAHNEALLKKLLQLGADPSIVDYQEQTPLHTICWHGGSPKAVELVLQALSTADAQLINHQDQDGNTALHYACFCEHYTPHLPALEQLLACTAIDANIVNHKGLTPLHLLCKRANGSDVKKAIRLMLQAPNINITATDDNGKTALDYYRERYEINNTQAWTLEQWQEYLEHQVS